MVPPDTELAPVLAALGVSDIQRLGGGSEASVYALDPAHVARIHRLGVSDERVAFRSALLAEIAHSAHRVPFALPTVVEERTVAGRFVTVERRLPGEPLDAALGRIDGAARERLIRRYLDAVAQIGTLTVDRPWFGDLRESDAVRAPTFRAYLVERAARSLADAGPAFARIDPAALASALPEPPERSLVHFDAFAGNVLADGDKITAILDFGTASLIGDPRLDPLAAVVYLAPEITPAATDQDRAVAAAWLAERGWDSLRVPAERWMAAYWAFATDDTELHAWCRRILMIAPE